MRVLSPVGTFPLRLTGARLERSGPVVDTAMGAWRSEVRLDRADVPVAAAAACLLAGAFLIGWASGHRTRRR